MKKVFSLLLVVAMLVSMAVVASAAPANEAGGMHTVITETDTDITVSVYAKNYTQLNGFVLYLITDLELVDGSFVNGATFSNWSPKIETKTDGIKIQLNAPDADSVKTSADQNLGFSFKVTKAAGTEISEADFAYSTSTLKVSKLTTITGGTVAGVTAGNNFTTAKQPTGFTIAYVDDRAPIVEEPEFGYTLDGKNVTCYGKLDATQIGSDYGVEFTAASTVEGARAQKYAGAKLGDVIGGNTVVLDGWDGTFEIVLQGIHAGAKEFKFYIGEGYATDAFTFTVE